MALLKNGTTSGVPATGTAGYSFPSASFTHKKQPNMPSDQKAKLLAMHRDGKANAGIYVAVVLVVYFILVIILLCRYGKRRRTPEPSSGPDSATEQGRFSKITSCNGCGECCIGNLSSFCFSRCQRVDTMSSKPAVVPAQTGNYGEKVATKSLENEMQVQSKVNEEGEKDKEVDKCQNSSKDIIGKKKEEESTPATDYDDHQNEDSEESLEDD